MLRNDRGFNLVEIIAAAVIGALLAGGTMTAFVMTMKTSQAASAKSEATQLAQQTLERFRNEIACDSGWFNPANCQPGTLPSGTSDPLPGTSVLSKLDASASRKYTVEPADCDEVGGPGDCFKVVTTVNWTPPQ